MPRIGTVTLNTAGIINVNLGYVPNIVRAILGAKGGSSATQTLCLGHVDVANGFEGCKTETDDHAGHYAYNTSGDFIVVWLHNGTTWVTDLLAQWNGVTGNGFSLNVITAGNYQVTFDTE